MSSSTNLISGLASGFDWRSMVDQLMKIEHRGVDRITSKKTEVSNKLTEWQSFNAKLLALKTSAENLKDYDDFSIFSTSMTTDSSTVKAADLLSVTASSSASPGTYNIIVKNKATAEKLASRYFSSITDSMGSSYSGNILINGRAVTISESDDLVDIRDKINNLNSGNNATGVTASIVNYGVAGYRLTLTSKATGGEGIALLNASSNDIFGNLGFTEKVNVSQVLKNSITGGAQSDRFTSTNQTIGNLLGLNIGESSTSLIIKDANGDNSNEISINLATNDLNDICVAINNNKGAANISASVISEKIDGTTYYRLQIDGINSTSPFSDQNNIFQALGLIKSGVGDVLGISGSEEMTSSGMAISTSIKLCDIDGYLAYTAGDHIDYTGKNIAAGDVNGTFNISADSTVQDLLDAIESAYSASAGDVTATITGTGNIQIVDNTTGESFLNVTLTSTVADGALNFGIFGAAGTLMKRQLVAGADASIEIDGVTVTSSDNSIDDVIAGVTINLLKADEATTVTLDVGQDIDGTMEKINAFVSSYNAVASYIYQQQSYDTQSKETGGILFGDGTLSSVKMDVSSLIIESVWGVSSEFATLGLAGINLDNEGNLSVDTDALKGYLQTNFNDIRNLFCANGTTSNGNLQYIGCSKDTESGNYSINITQAATQSSSTSNSAVAAILGSDETLTITEGGKTASIVMTSSMTLSDIVNAVNSELDEVYTQTLAGSEVFYADAAKTTLITASTNWNSIYDSSGSSANLANGDVISFSGTSRSGASVTGSYTISDVSQDTVQDFLNALEQAFSNNVTASIDSSGALKITDKTTGNSQLAVSFDCSQAHSLSFGSVDTSNSGGQQGRYAINITASMDSSNHLVLTHNSYGSQSCFTISETADLLWTGDQTGDNGLDVSGTINGEAATGSGQTLTGDDGESGVSGLVIKYTGSSTGEIGTVKITLGVAEAFNRTLYNITDSIDGYVSYKQKSLQNTISDYTTQIEEMGKVLERKQETMINRFVAMEALISKFQNQSNWLLGQLSAAESGWR